MPSHVGVDTGSGRAFQEGPGWPKQWRLIDNSGKDKQFVHTKQSSSDSLVKNKDNVSTKQSLL
ncbi:hypothetical protein AAVH_23684, partial [Aphelenchoides avenae]